MTADYSSKPVAGASDHEENFFQRWLILPKTLYFLLNIFVYAFHGVMAPFFIDKWGFTYYQYGFASMVIATNFVGAMFWTNLADRTGKYKTIIMVASTLYTFTALATLVPLFPDGSILRYVWVFFLLGCFNFFLSAAFPLVDAQILGMLAANPRVNKDQFGNQRMFGALGHFAATLLSFSIYNKKNPVSQAIFQCVVSVVFMAAIWFGIPDVKPLKGHGHHGGQHAKSDKNGTTEAPKSPLKALITNPSFMFFMLFVAASGMVRAVTTNYQKPIGLMLSKEENVPKAITSLLNKISGNDAHRNKNIMTALLDTGRTISEVLVYFTAKYIKNALGIYWVLAFSQIAGIARLWGYSFINYDSPNAWYYANTLELFKGFNSGLISTSAIPIASSLAPPGCEGTAQGLYSGNYSGAAMAVGGFVSGIILYFLYTPILASSFDSKKLYDEAINVKNFKDLQTMFSYVSIISIVITILLISKFIFVDRVMGLPGFPRKYSSPQH